MGYASAKKILLPIFSAPLKAVEGGDYLPDRPPYLLAINHIDFLDGFYVAAAVERARGHRVHFITKTKNYWWTQATIPVDPENRSASLDIAREHLNAGRVICNFIEGERNPTGTMLPGKTGTARLALATNVPLIPVGLVGPSGKNFAHSLTNLLTERKAVTVRFGPAVDLDQFRRRPVDQALLRQATDEIVRAIAPLCGKRPPT